MPQIIANTYEILDQIGSGGGGIVYRGKHLRLNKTVVLKADKRSLSASSESLRREVDILKNLNQTYIPQVYDFLYEDGIAYTVTDYIEGESLDKVLQRGETVSQPQLVTWACQLLEALVYLHSRSPYGILHSDIKPANIMVTPEGDIRLIDFNIALALGEEGAVRVGYSFGYASPEHYSAGRSSNRNDLPTPVETKTEHVYTSDIAQKPLYGSANGRGILLDARSDIYSLGATLYHMISGVRPAKEAEQVVPLTQEQVSLGVIEIITKAMQPNPEDRYQTAEEMLAAFEHLHENDPRSKRLKRNRRIVFSVLTAILLVGLAMAFTGQRQMTQQEAELARQESQRAEEQAQIAAQESQRAEEQAQIAAQESQRAEQQTQLAEEQTVIAEQQSQRAEEQSQLAAQEAQRAEEQTNLATQETAINLAAQSREALNTGDVQSAVNLAVQSLELVDQLPEGQKALTDALGVYNLATDFYPSQTITLSAAPFKATLSPEGTRLAAMYSWKLEIYDTSTGNCVAQLDVVHSALSEVVFLNEGMIIYSGLDGICAYDLESHQVMWSGEIATGITLSGDGTRVAAVYGDAGEAIVYDVETGELFNCISFRGRSQRMNADHIYIDNHDNLLSLNQDGTLLAASFSDGTLSVFDTVSGVMVEDLLDPGGYIHFEGGFYQDYFVFCARGSEEYPLFAMVNLDDPAADKWSRPTMDFKLQVDDNGIYIAAGNTLVRIDPETGEQTKMAYTTEKDISAFRHTDSFTIVAASECFSFYDRAANLLSSTDTTFVCDFVSIAGSTALVASRDTPVMRLLTLDDHGDAEIFAYDPSYFHLETRFSVSDQTLMLFSRDEFSLYSLEGNLLAQVSLPDSEQIYDQQFRREDDHAWLEVTYYSGLVHHYSAADGALSYEEQTEPPPGDLEEDFYTDDYWIHTVPHEAPKVYDLETGDYLFDLNKEDGLTYVTQVGEYIITEYISTQGDRYGLLLNENCETLARLPYLCDIVDHNLIFDCPSGDIRTSKIYSLEELLELAASIATE